MSLYSANQARRSLIDTLRFRGLSQIATVLSYVVLVRGMPKADFGVFNLLYSFIPVLGTVASLGLEQILRRYQPEYLQLGNAGAAASLVRFIASARFALNIVLIGALLLAWSYLAPIFHLGPYRVQFAFFSVLLILHFQAQILALSMAAHMLHRFSVGSIAILSIGKLIGYCAMFATGSLTLNRAIFVDTVAYALVYLFMTVVHRRYCVPRGVRVPPLPPRTERKRLFRYGVFNNFNDAGSFLLGGAADNFFIAAFIDPISVGIYSFYNRLNEMAINVLPVRLFDNIIQPLFFSIKPAEAKQKIRLLFTFLLDINLILMWPIFAFTIVYHDELVQVIFGGKFIEFAWLLPLIILSSVINSIAVPVTLVAQYEEKAGSILLSKIFVVYNVVAMLVLLPILGLYGAILARGSAETFKNLFIWWRVRDRAQWTNAGPLLLTAVLLWGAVIAADYALKQYVGGPGILQLTCGVLTSLVGLLVYIRTPAIAASDRVILASILHGRETRALHWLGLSRAPAPSAA
jgi:O-antigen/teichoic acid export membrane protein